jgi:hypothetical protein
VKGGACFFGAEQLALAGLKKSDTSVPQRSFFKLAIQIGSFSYLKISDKMLFI